MNIDFWIDLLMRLGVRDTVADDWADTFARVMSTTQWTSPDDLPNFLAQVVHESGRLATVEEDLNYSAIRITQVWPNRFPNHTAAAPYARNPRALANRVYNGRMGNVGPNDGWRYRGRGLIQITGRNNYSLAADLTGLPLLDQPDLLLQQEPALRASIAWWEESVPDAALASVARVTRAVNGGAHGLAERERLTAIAHRVLSEVPA